MTSAGLIKNGLYSRIDVSFIKTITSIIKEFKNEIVNITTKIINIENEIENNKTKIINIENVIQKDGPFNEYYFVN